jgi:DNA repair exonuclease SbcCD ATPase subunit
MLNQNASIKDYQEYFEKNILNMDFQTFTQIVILGKATYVAFLRLSLNDRRKFIENILNLTIFGNMSDINKTRIATVKNDIEDTKNEIKNLRGKIELLEKHIYDFKQESTRQKIEHEKMIDTQVNDILQTIKECQDLISEKQSLLKNTDDIDKLKKTLDKCNNYKSQIKTKCNDLKKRLIFFSNNSICPTCESIIDSNVKINKINDLQSKELELLSAQDTLNEKISNLLDSIKSIQDDIKFNNDINVQIKILNNTIIQKEILIQSLEEKREFKSESVDNKIEEYTLNLKELENKRNEKLDYRMELSDLLDCYETIGSMLKDTGIKANIIKKHIPNIISIMNRYLRSLGIFVRFDLNENFEETLYNRGFDELSYNSFSEGQKLRIDLAMLLTWRSITKSLNNMAINFIIFDEILDASLDEAGAEALISLFREMTKDNIKVVVVSHSTDKWESGFKEVKTVSMKGGFSVIENNQH